MSASVFHNGYYGTAAVGSSELAITHWDVQPTAATTEFRNSKSGGFVVRETNFKDCVVTLSLDFDFGNNPFQAPTAIQIGATLTNVNLYLHQTTAAALNGPAWTFSNLVVDSTPQQLAVDGKITTKIVCKGSGSFTYPS